MNIKNRIIGLVFIAFLIPATSHAFSIIGDTSLNMLISEDEEPVVHVALDMFNGDMELVSGKKVSISNSIADNTILIGTIGKNKYIDELIAARKISVKKIEGKWEAFQIQVVEQNKKKILIVIGSDKRGTAYGILELSRLIGVSPWVYWADSAPDKKSKLDIPDNYFNSQKPSVQYRGIFINDEDLGFMPWSTQTIDKATQEGATGPKAYSKVFELMLRLRANTLWPAMHDCTVPFYKVEGNKELADKYAIVVGTSHHEPLMRNTAEWDNNKLGEFNYLTNKDTLLEFWTERVKELNNSENYYTLGIRGAGDVGMQGVNNTLEEKTDVLRNVIKDQRTLLKKYINEDVEKVPQVFVPYKEVLPIYENNLQVPDDITLMWCDDNYGYMTRLSNPEEQKRSGGTGIYYHISYLGRPHQYIWLSSTQPALVYWQMKQAWDYGARKIWILNVGDIKPAEYDIEFYLDMAWNINSVNENNIYAYQEKWLEREFGKEFFESLGNVRNEYYRLAHIRKPEFMGWSRQEEGGYGRSGRTPVVDTEFNPYAFGDEMFVRLKEYEAIVDKAEKIGKRISEYKKDAYNQLVLFPVRGSAEMNKKLLYAQKARLYAKYDLPVANEYAAKSNAAFDKIVSLVDHYNKTMAGGKWNGMMFRRAWGAPVYEKAPLPDTVQKRDNDDVLIWAENQSEPAKQHETIKLTPLVNPIGKETFVSVFAYNGKSPHWKVSKKPDWLEVRSEELDLSGEIRIVFSINPARFTSDDKKDICIININNKPFTFEVEARSVNKSTPSECNKMIIVDVNQYHATGENPIQIEGLGYSTKAINLQTGKSNAISYKIYTTSSGNAEIRVATLPNHPTNGENIRYAISIDGGTPKVISIDTDFKQRDEAWKINVLRNQSVTTTQHYFDKAGEHTITIYALDQGIILDQLSVDFQSGRKFYRLPSTRAKI